MVFDGMTARRGNGNSILSLGSIRMGISVTILFFCFGYSKKHTHICIQTPCPVLSVWKALPLSLCFFSDEMLQLEGLMLQLHCYSDAFSHLLWSWSKSALKEKQSDTMLNSLPNSVPHYYLTVITLLLEGHCRQFPATLSPASGKNLWVRHPLQGYSQRKEGMAGVLARRLEILASKAGALWKGLQFSSLVV